MRYPLQQHPPARGDRPFQGYPRKLAGDRPLIRFTGPVIRWCVPCRPAKPGEGD